jgi:hypothetical protein
MSFYVVELNPEHTTKRNKGYVVSANTVTEARDLCKAQYQGDASDGAWGEATVTTLADVVASASASLLGWRFKIILRDSAGAFVEKYEYTGVTTDDLDDMGDGLVVALLAGTTSLTSAYTAGSQLLDIAIIDDGVGDHTVEFYAYPPVVTDAQGVTISQEVNVDAFMSSQVHEGIAGAVLTITFNADTIAVPNILNTLPL